MSSNQTVIVNVSEYSAEVVSIYICFGEYGGAKSWVGPWPWPGTVGVMFHLYNSHGYVSDTTSGSRFLVTRAPHEQAVWAAKIVYAGLSMMGGGKPNITMEEFVNAYVNF